MNKSVVWMDARHKDAVLTTIYLQNVYHILHILMIVFWNVSTSCGLVNILSLYTLYHNPHTHKPF
jgi:hypothetical protein